MLYALRLLVALWVAVSFTSSLVYASPAQVLETRQSGSGIITTLDAAAVTSYKPYTFYASAAYCQPAATLTWSCGVVCDANPSFQPRASGGNGDLTQFWFVGFDPILQTVIVSHQGTDKTKIFAVATDLNFIALPLHPVRFPGVSPLVLVHSGFMLEQAMTATTILSAVNTVMAEHGVRKVTVVGHSLGAALALVDGVYLSLNLPKDTFVQVVGYGMPRVGNQAWANLVDGLAPKLSVVHINNRKDPIPTIPGRGLGYRHPSGELHIMESNSAWVSCPGQDNTDKQCIIGAVPNIFESNSDDHRGPYDGLVMGCR